MRFLPTPSPVPVTCPPTEDPSDPPAFGIGTHPLLREGKYALLTELKVFGLRAMVDSLLERMRTGRDPLSRREWPAWSALTWDEVALALLVRTQAEPRTGARPQHVDLDAPRGATWPWETERA